MKITQKKVDGRKNNHGIVLYTDELIASIADKLDKWIQEPEKFWLGTFAAEQGFARQRLSDFANKNDYFKQVYEKAKQIQENKLMMLGLSNKGNCAMAIFALKNVAGWRDNQGEVEDDQLKETELTFSGIPPKNGKPENRYSRYLN